jgi:hypothetical protein
VAQFPGQRPPAQAGNSLAVTSGANSQARVLAVALEIEARLRADPDTPPYLRAPGSHALSVRALCRTEAVVMLLSAWLDTQDVEAALTEKYGEEETIDRPAMGTMRRSMTGRRVASVLDQLHKAETRAMHLRSKLGLDPLARAKLSKDWASTFDLAKQWADDDRREREADGYGDAPGGHQRARG